VGAYDDIGLPVKGQPISSGAFGIKVRNAILDLDRRVSTVDTSTGTGLAYSTSSVSLTSTTEIAALTISNFTFKAGLAYEAGMYMGVQTSVTANPNPANPPFISARIRKFNATPSAGDDWGLYQRYAPIVGAAVPASCYGAIYLINNTSADITSSCNFIVAAATAAVNNTSIVATATTPRYFILKPSGFAVNFVGVGQQVT
jgi:hypothetical protein